MVIVIGAGPAGLAIGYQLQKKGCSYVILERDAVGNSWLNHYDSLSLHTLKDVSHLPGLSFPDSTSRFPTKNEFSSYLQAYAHHFRLNIETGIDVKRAVYERNTLHGNRWHLRTNHSDYYATTLVASTGIWSSFTAPHFSGQEQFAGELIPAKQYKNPKPFIGKRVLVVGAGNTAADLAVELAEAGITTGVAVRDGADFVPYPNSASGVRAAAFAFRHLPASISNRILKRPDFSELGIPRHPAPPVHAYPVVGFKLPNAVRDGIITTHPGIERLGRNVVCFTDGGETGYDVLLLATGYQPALSFLRTDGGQISEVELDQRGWPLVDRAYRSQRNKSLFLAGYDYPATSGWIQNMNRVARVIGRKL